MIKRRSDERSRSLNAYHGAVAAIQRMNGHKRRRFLRIYFVVMTPTESSLWKLVDSLQRGRILRISPTHE